MECRGIEALWICLICGHVGCDREQGHHAALHYKATNHSYAIHLGISYMDHVWDFCRGDIPSNYYLVSSTIYESATIGADANTLQSQVNESSERARFILLAMQAIGAEVQNVPVQVSSLNF